MQMPSAISDALGCLRHPRKVADATAALFTSDSPLQMVTVLLELSAEASETSRIKWD